MASHFVKEYNFATIRLKKNDLIKIGRIRFKIKEIVSPIYVEENARSNIISEQYKLIFPPVD